MFKINDFDTSVLTQTVPLTEDIPRVCISAALATTEIAVKEMGGNKELGIFVFASRPATPLGALIKLEDILPVKALLVKNEMGLLASLVLSTFPNPKLDLSITISPMREFTDVTAPLLLDKTGLLIKSR